MASGYRNLIVWQKAFDLVEKVYILSKKFPKEELYSFIDQIRRAAVSIQVILRNEAEDEVMPNMYDFLILPNDPVPSSKHKYYWLRDSDMWIEKIPKYYYILQKKF